MANSIVQHDIASLLDSWIEAERNGVQFPVPLHDYWSIAGHKNKQDAFKLVESRQESGFDFLGSALKNNPGRGRKAKAMFLTVAALERFCLAAHTPEGDAIRELYRQSKAKWDLVKQIAPEFAGQIEVIAAQQELEKLKQQTFQSEQNLLSFRHYVTTALPKPTADRILGVTEIPEIEYRDRIVKDGIVINDGGTINKTEICKRFGILTKNGKPDYPRLNKSLSSMELPESAWVESEVIQTNRELKREYLEVLDRALYSAKERQLFLGE